MEEHLYHYRALVRSVHDGDTCTLDIDLGLGTWVHGEKVRLSRINAPELSGANAAAGRASRDYLRAQIDGREVWINTQKDKREKYGRYLADIWIKDEADVWININDALVNNGHAVYAEY